MASSSYQTPRIFTRGETSQFRVGFFADQAQTIPLQPISPEYPSYTIFDPSGTPIQSGMGTVKSPGNWTADFLVPKDAPLSYFQQAPQQYNDQGQGAPLTADGGRYRIEWIIVTAENYQVQFVEEFDVRDIAVTQSHSRELKYMTMAGDAVRLMYRSSVLPYKVKLKMIVRGDDNNPVVSEEFDNSVPPATGNIQYAKDGGSYVLYFDVPENTTQQNTAYIALWSIQETAFAVPSTEFQIVVAISSNILPVITALRMLIDRFQKRIGRLQAYEDSDLLEYISHGLRMVNLSYPTTSFNMNQVPDDLLTHVTLAAAWYGLSAQAILETDLNFNFSGQSVTLSVDRASALESHASKLMDWYNSSIGPAKMAYVRRSRGIGTVAGRAYNYRQMYQYVYRISSMGSDGLLNTLTKIGLL